MARSINRIIKNCGFRGFIHGSITTSSFTGSSTPSSLKNCFFATRRTVTTTGSFRTPERWYTDKHEWITIDGNIGTVGISDYAQDSLGDVVYAQLPDVGAVIKKDEECGALESVKAASELISPVTGKVIEKNEAVEGKPGLINTSCYKEGWLYKIQLTDSEEIKNLMNEEAYNLFLKSDPQ